MQGTAATFKPYGVDLGLAALTILTRLPFASRLLYNWDAAQYALALERFDVAQHQPHPPGYLSYVLLGKLAGHWLPDANAAYVAVSILASAVAVVLFYRFVLLLLDDRAVAGLAALAFLVNPYVWFHGEVASVYIFDALFAVAFATFALRIMATTDVRWLYGFTATLGASGGFRQSLLVLFAPLWLAAAGLLLWRRRLGWRPVFGNLLIGGGAVALWLLPLILTAGGWTAYWTATSRQLSTAAAGSSILAGASWATVRSNARVVRDVTVAVVLPLLPLLLSRLVSGRRGVAGQSPRVSSLAAAGLFAVWLIPSYLAYTLVHFGNAGYLMTVAPALLGAGVVLAAGRNRRGDRRTVVVGLLGTVAAISALAFLVAGDGRLQAHQFLGWLDRQYRRPTYWSGRFTRAAIERGDGQLGAYLAALRRYDARTSAVVTEWGFSYPIPGSAATVRNTAEYFRQLEYYLPEYVVYEIFGTLTQHFATRGHAPLQLNRSAAVTLPRGVERLLLVADDVDRNDLRGERVEIEELAGGQRLFVIDVPRDRPATYHGYRFARPPSI